jgi:hypothetical protein
LNYEKLQNNIGEQSAERSKISSRATNRRRRAQSLYRCSLRAGVNVVRHVMRGAQDIKDQKVKTVTELIVNVSSKVSSAKKIESTTEGIQPNSQSIAHNWFLHALRIL